MTPDINPQSQKRQHLQSTRARVAGWSLVSKVIAADSSFCMKKCRSASECISLVHNSGGVLAAILDGGSTSWRGGADEVDERLAEQAGLVADGFVRYDAQAVMDASAVTQRCPLSVRVLLSSIDDDDSADNSSTWSKSGTIPI